MNTELNIEWLLALEEALATNDWKNETAVINHVNRVCNIKITDPEQINQAIVLVSTQLKHNYPLRCFLKQEE